MRRPRRPAPARGSTTAELTHDQDGNTYLSDFELLARERLVMRAEDPDTFHAILARVYGNYRYQTAESIRLAILDGDFSWAPDVQLVDRSVLGDALGAYSEQTGMVYLNDEVPDSLTRTMIYLEETASCSPTT